MHVRRTLLDGDFQRLLFPDLATSDGQAEASWRFRGLPRAVPDSWVAGGSGFQMISVIFQN